MLMEKTDFFGKMSEKYSGKIIPRDKTVERIDWDFRSKGRGTKTRVRKLERQNLSKPSTSDSTRPKILLSPLHSAN